MKLPLLLLAVAVTVSLSSFYKKNYSEPSADRKISSDAIAEANDLKLPSSFMIENSQRGVFVDFIHADYRFEINQKGLTPHLDNPTEPFYIIVKSKIQLRQFEKGHILLDLKNKIFNIKINDKLIATSEISTPKTQGSNFQTRLIKLNEETDAGTHEVEIFSTINFKEKNFGLWLNDWDDRSLLERYTPTNLQFDQYSMQFTILKNKMTETVNIMTNGTLSQTPKAFKVIFPKHINSSSTLLHIIPKSEFTSHHFIYSDNEKREIKVELYSDHDLYDQKRLQRFEKRVKLILSDLEQTWGAWPHKKVVIAFDQCDRSMEYSGGTRICNHEDIAHELAHSYWGRSVYPADGNSSWLDEAIVTWSIDLKAEVSEAFKNSFLPYRMEPKNYSNNGTHFRATNQDSYYSGAGLIASLGLILNKQQNKQGNALIFKCLKGFYDKNSLSVVSTEDFKLYYTEACYKNNTSQGQDSGLQEITELFKKFVL